MYLHIHLQLEISNEFTIMIIVFGNAGHFWAKITSIFLKKPCSDQFCGVLIFGDVFDQCDVFVFDKIKTLATHLKGFELSSSNTEADVTLPTHTARA
jgi:hypothetical protein